MDFKQTISSHYKNDIKVAFDILKFWFKPPAIDILNWKTFHIFNVHMYSNILINQNFNPTSITITQTYILLWWRFRLDSWIDTRKCLVTLVDDGRGTNKLTDVKL